MSKHTNRTRYTDEQRANLCVMLESEGYKPGHENGNKGALARVSEYSNVPASTLRGWFKARNNPPPAQLREGKRLGLAELFEEAANRYLEHALGSDVIAEMRGKDAIIAAATATDKMRLLREQSTNNEAVASRIEVTYRNIDERNSDS